MTFRSTIGRALRLRCGADPLFRGFIAVRPACTGCGQSFHPDQGYYVGAMYVNYLTTAAVIVTVALLTMDRISRPAWLAGDIAISSRKRD